MDDFAIDPRILASSEPLAQLELCTARLQADARFPWIVLIPRRPGLRELEHLTPGDRAALLEEAVLAGEAVRAIGQALGRPVEKLNLGALGNIVPQLHLHVVGRREGDPAWPGPVWSSGQPEPYSDAALSQALAAARAALQQARA